MIKNICVLFGLFVHVHLGSVYCSLNPIFSDRLHIECSIEATHLCLSCSSSPSLADNGEVVDIL